MTTSNSDQTIYGTSKSNILVGGNGNDTIYGNAGNDIISAGNGNDYVDGGDGNDIIDGGDGNDTLLGGAGNDILYGGEGNDYLDGGSGTDLVFGDDGNDTLAFRMAEHGPASTSFFHTNTVLDGGSDTDTFRLILTRDEWLRADVQADVARYVAFLNAEPGKLYNFANKLFGNTDFNGSFTFSVFDLVVSRMEKFEVVVDGLTLDPRNEAVTARADAITTDEDHASVAFNLLANDSVPDLVKSVSVGTAAHGTVVLTQNYVDPAKPVASVVYTPNATYYQYLAAGETAVDSFTYTVTDANGDTSTAVATVTITGVNDGPMIVSGSYAGAVVEDAATTLASNGSIVFSDLDLTDSHTVTVGAAKVTVANDTATGIAPTGGFGTLKAVVVENTTDQNNQGTINWSFTADNATVQRLAVGQTATQVYTLTLTDKNGASVTQNVTITLTGTEDAPTITSATATGAVTEDATTAVQGNIAFADADLIDTHSVAFTPQAAGYLGTFATVIDKSATGTGAGSVKWTFAVDNAQIQNLAQGETLTQKYTVTVADNHGGTVQQVVTVTITGTNDAPVAVADVAAPAVEDGAVVTGSVATNDSDVDHGAVLTYKLNAPVAGLTLNSNGSYSFDPSNAAYQALAQGEVQTIVANYTVTDDKGATATTTLTIKITGTNDAPVAVADTNAVTEDSTITGSVATNDSDVDHGAVLTYKLNVPVAGLTLNGNGSYSFDASNAAYQALAQGEVQTILASYTVTDDKGATATTTLTIKVTGTNDAPVAVADVAAVTEDSTITGSVATNDTDVDHGATRTFALNAPVAGLTLNSNGTYTFDASNAAYQSLAKNEILTVLAYYTVTDDKGATATTTLTITVTGTNDAPVAVADVAAPAVEDGAVVTGSVATNDTDVDHGATRTFALAAPVAGLTLAANGTYSFDPSNAAYQALAKGEVQTIVASYIVTDEYGATATTTLTLTITGTNDAPVITSMAAAAIGTVVEAGVHSGGNTPDAGTPSVSGRLTSSDVDHGATATWSGSTAGTYGAFAISATGTWTYTLNNASAATQALAFGETATETFTAIVTDDQGATATQVVTVTVVGTNDAPIAVADIAAPAIEDGALVTGSVATNDSDVDHGAHLTYTLAAPVAGLTLNADGGYSFDPGNAAYQSLAVGETRAISASYIVTDEFGATATSTLAITITGTNDAPTIVTGVYAGAVTEDMAATLTTSGSLVFSDVDLTDTHSVSVAAKPGTADQHFGTLTAVIAENATDQDPTGTVNWVFVADNATVQTLAQGEVSTQVYTLTVSDGHGGTVARDVTITVTGTNDVPVIVGASNGAVTEDGAVTASGDIAFTDVDRIDTHTVSYTALGTGYRGSFAATLGSDSSLGATGHVGWTFGVDNAAVQDLAEGEVLTQQYRVTITDDHGLSTAQIVTVTITGTNDAPVAAADVGAVAEDSILTGSVATNDSDVDHGAVLSYALDAPVAGLTVNTDGSYSFDAGNAAYQSLAQGETLVVVAHYTVTDEHGATAKSTLSVTVTGTNDAPVAVADAISTVEDQPVVVGSVATNDSDVDHNAHLSYAIDTPVAGLTLNADGSYSFDPSNAAYQPLAKGEVQTIVTSYTVTDEFGAHATAKLTITVTGTNDAPVARVSVTSAVEDGAVVTGSVATNAYDVDHGATLSFALPTPVAGLTLNADGSYSFDAGNAAYQSLAQGETQTVVANYAVTDNEGVTTYSALVIVVTGTNDAPVAVVDAASVIEDNAILTGSVATNDYDVDHGATLTYALDAPVAGLTIAANGAYSFDPSAAAYQGLALGEVQTVVASYTVTDQFGAHSQSTLTITVTGTNDAPVAAPDTGAIAEDSVLTGSVATNDSDVDHGAVLHYALDAPVAGLTINADGSYSFDAGNPAYQALAQGETLAVVGHYTVTDEYGATSQSTLTVTVTGTNDAPIAAADTGAVVEDSILTGSVATNDSDVDHGAVLSYALDAPVAGLTVNADGSYSFDAGNAAYQSLAQGETLAVIGHYTVTDQFGATSQSTLTITVTGTNDAPVALADVAAVNEDSVVTGSVATNDSDVDHGAVLAYALNAPVAGLHLNADGSYLFNAANPAYQALAQGEVQLVVAAYTVTDQFGATSTSTLAITVTGTNDAPVVSGPLTVAAVEDDAIVRTDALANASDVDHGTVLIAGVPGTLPAGVTYDAATHSFALDPSAAVFQALAQGEVLTTSVSYTVSDGIATVPTSITWTVTGTNDAPVAVADVAAVMEDSVISGSVATNDSDVDHGAVLTYALDAPIAGLTLNANGSYSFNAGNAVYQQLAQGEVQNVVASYTVTDQFGAHSSASLTIAVTGRNDGPVAVADSATAIEDGAVVTGSVGANDSDVDHGAVLTYAGTNTIAGLTIAADGSYTFDPSNAAYQNLGAGATRTVVGTYKVTDQFGAAANSTLSITVTGTNDAPVVGNVSLPGNFTLVANRLTNGGFDAKPDFTGWTVSTASIGTTAVQTSTATVSRTGTLIAGDTAVASLNYAATVPFDRTATVGNYKTGYGPSITSAAFTGYAGDTVKFIYQLSSGSDQAVGTGYIRDAATGAIVQTIFDYKVPFTGSTGVQTVTLTLASTGTYTIDFRVGSYDATNGGAIGARLDIGFAGIVSTGISEDAPYANANGRAQLLAAARDVDVGDTLTIAPFTTTTAHGAVVTLAADGTLTIDPRGHADELADGEQVIDTFVFQVSDGHGGLTSATASYNLVGQNDAPVAVADTASAIEGGAVVLGSVATNDSDVDHGAVLSYKLNAAVAGLTLNTNGSYSFDPTNPAYDSLAAGVTKQVVANYTVTDDHGATATAALTITVTGTNDAPVAVADSFTVGEDGSLTLPSAMLTANDTDVDGDTLTVSAIDTTGTLGTVALSGGTVTYTPGSAFQYLKDGQTAVDHFTYTISDGHGGFSTATETITVTGANDAPKASDDTLFALTAQSATVNVLANDSDPEGDTISVVSASAGAHGTTVVNPDGTISYTSAAGYAGSDSFTYTVKDPSGATSTASVAVTVGVFDHNTVAGNVYLQGNYMEIGVSASGSLGTTPGTAPSNYHPSGGRSNISYVVDTDGWTAGAPPKSGDFTLPGSPVDTIVLGINGHSFAQDERSGYRQINTTTVDTTVGTTLQATTTGDVNDGTGTAHFTQVITLDANATYYSTTITVTNTGTSTLTDVRFLRSFDPDQDVDKGGSYATINDVLSNPSAGNALAISQAKGPLSQVSVNLVSFDAGAHASNYGFLNTNAYDPNVSTSPVDRNGQTVDEAISLELGFGNIGVGETVTKTFYTSLNGSSGANDMLIGTNGNDVLNGGAGDDIILGLGGNDTLTGGAGNDHFIFTKGSGADVITDFVGGAGTSDVIELRGMGFSSFNDVKSAAFQAADGVHIDLHNGDSLVLQGVSLASLNADDFLFA